MPAEALSLALAASIYPPALAAVIALGRGVEVRLRVVLLVVAAYLTVFVTGCMMLLLFADLGATGESVRSPSAGLYLIAGVILLGVARRLRRSRPHGPSRPSVASRTERYLQSRRLVLMLGFILYVVPSPIYVGGVKAIVDAHASTAQELLYLGQMLLVMLWIIELPMLMLIAFPDRSAAVLEKTNEWFARHGRELAALASAGLGAYLIAVGLVELIG